MVHPNVLREVATTRRLLRAGPSASASNGWALTRYEVDDIRRFVTSDTDFLSQLA